MKSSRLSQSGAALLSGALCLAILGGMIVGHAWPLWTGQDVLLRVVPVDPRDMFRGEYVRLDVPMTRLAVNGAVAPAARVPQVTSTGAWWDSRSIARPHRLRGRTVYVQLEQQAATGEYAPVTVSRQRVPGAINLKGRVRQPLTGKDGLVLLVDYGVDAYFMQEGTPLAVEKAMREGRTVQMQVAIAASGRARIRHLLVDGRRW